MSTYQNARVYWEMFGGVNEVGQPDLYVRSLDLDLDVGGYYAHDYPFYQLGIYGRASLDGPDLDTLYHADIVAPSTTDYWTPRRIRVSVVIGIDEPEEQLVRCLVIKTEAKYETIAEPTAPAPTKQYKDQYGESDPPPWGIRIHKASVYGSSLGRNVRPDLVLAEILDNVGFTYSGPAVTWAADQLAFVDIPKDRQDALDDVNGMLGWNYACWDGEEVEFALPKSGTAHVIAASDPRTTWSVEESLDETYNAVRVCYGNKNGKLREVIVHGSTAALRGTVRADTLQAPESIKSEKAATRFAKRYLASHETKQVAGSVSIQGSSTVVTASGYTDNIIPAMTSATAPSGVASASSEYSSNYAAWEAFDHTVSNLYWCSAGTPTGWLQYQFPSAHAVTRYAVTSPESVGDGVPKSWTFKGSNDGAAWTTLDTQTNITDWAALADERKVFDIANSTAYSYYRLDITASNAGTYVSVNELEMMETTFVDVGLDPLLIRPGDTVKMTGPARSLSGTHEITRVTLRPLEWTADVEFGTNSKRFDTWLARLAAGAKSIKRR